MTSSQIYRTPHLLVSVRSVEEAIEVRSSACAIVDVKEPANGPLGRASDAVQEAVLDACGGSQPVSFALGEVVDWEPTHNVPSAEYLKLGLAGLGSEPDWTQRWQAVRQKIDSTAKAQATWVAVSYADHHKADAPSPAAVLDAAVETGCRVYLLDTFDKASGKNLFDLLTVTELIDLRNAAVTRGLDFAVAGQLRAHHAELLAAVSPDIIGIRGAACSGSIRSNRISIDAVDEFAAAITQRPAAPGHGVASGLGE